MKFILPTLLALLASGIAQAGPIDDIIEMERRDAERLRGNSRMEQIERAQLMEEQRQALRAQRQMNELQTLRLLGGQPVYPPAGGIQPLGLPPLGY